MRKLLFLAVVTLVASATVLPAAQIACAEVSTLSQLTLAGTTCLSQDKIFSNFSYTGGGSVTADHILSNVVFRQGSGVDIHGWAFVPDASFVSGWNTGFSLSYDITVAPGFPLIAIVQSKDQMNSGLVPNGVRLSDVQTGVTPNPLLLSGATGGVETIFSNTYNLQTIHTATTVTFVPTTGGFALQSYEQDWFQGSSIPEPMTFLLIGTGLVGLGLLRRKTRKS